MKVTVEERGSHTRQQLAEKIDVVFERIDALPDKERAGRLHVLARALLAYTPFNYIFSSGAGQILIWLEDFLSFIEGRREPVAVSVSALGPEQRCFLMTNCPDGLHLLDSVQTHLKKQSLRFHVVAHPILTIARRPGGEVESFAPLREEGPKESFILVEFDGNLHQACPAIDGEIREVLAAALQVDWDREALLQALAALEQGEGQGQTGEFFGWLRKGNFLPFAYRCLEFERQGQRWSFAGGKASLGLALAECPGIDAESGSLDDLEPAMAERLLRQEELVVEPTDIDSPVHRHEALHYVGFRRQTGKDTFVEHAFWGLFSQHSISEPISDLPVLFRKIESALRHLHIPEDCYDYRKSVDIFNTFPRVELFFMGEDEIANTVRSFISLQRHGMVKVVVTRSLALRGLTLLVIMPKEFYTQANLARVENYLCRYLKANSAESRIIHVYSDYMSIHVGLRPAGDEVTIDIDRLETALTELVRPWDARVRHLLGRIYGGEQGGRLWRRYGSGFPGEYRAFSHPRFAVRDFLALERLEEQKQGLFDLWGPFGGEKGSTYRLQFYAFRESNLNELMPILENLSLCVVDEVDFPVSVGKSTAYIKSFTVRGPKAAAMPLSDLKATLLEALAAIWNGECENDYLNRLLVLTGLTWKEIDVFRGYRNYYFQLGTPFTKKRVAFALIHNPEAALLLIRYFEARFRPQQSWSDPMVREEEALMPLRLELIDALERVSDINEDRILRGLFNLIDSTVRTNFFRRIDSDDYFLSFKISAIGIIEMAFPRPLYETYVHSATMEGIHLRGGKVARGGIRWSDRPDDFRTEVLGLMKTQMTKNTLIVPVGSKGGFVVKKPYSDRERGAALSKAAYQTLMRGLLDLTDNRVGGQVVPPEKVVAYDDVDPYLVVAADKGTAHLSDTANGISADYSFWLGDAFASGGSRGYDHKKLGITARGGWECVKRHFRERGVDIQNEPFTVVGIGDMSGDVFGNGMLLSKQIRLLAAFDHRHIFLDPDPDSESSYGERRRLFDLPRSSWLDYDPTRISEGGGVWPRDAKDIPLSEPVRQWLGVRHLKMDGEDLVRALLIARTDLLWNGGIGTYVKASSEKNEDAGDRANDAVRVDAAQVRARVIGEGGNLGLTQKARIEYALHGGGINTDAIDNSAGVDSSDHEVNLKIFMQQLLEAKKIDSMQERDKLLEAVTEEVCRDVLANNYTQSLGLSLDQLRYRENAEPFFELSDRLVNAGLLDLQSEFLPTRKEVMARSGQAYTRPELAILLAYGKMQVYQEVLESDLPDRPGVKDLLAAYFADSIRQRFGDDLRAHPLAREITATVVTNFVLDRAGSTFLNSLNQTTGRSLVDGIQAYILFDRVMEGESLRQAIFSLDNRMPADLQYETLLLLEKTLFSLAYWGLDHDYPLAIGAETVASYRTRIDEYRKSLAAILPEEEWRKGVDYAARLEEGGAGRDLVKQISLLPCMEDFLPLVEISEAAGKDLHGAAMALREIRQAFGIAPLLAGLGRIPLRDRWDRMAARGLKASFADCVFRLAGRLLEEEGGNLEAFLGRHKQKVRDYGRMHEQVTASVPVNLHPYTVLVRVLEALVMD